MTKKKILVIDDMPNIVAMLKARLQASGYDVVTALNAQQALACASAEKPDLILLDIVMPAGGGYSVFTRLKLSSRTRSIPVIFLTAKDKPEDVARAYKLGVQYYIKKPYKPEMLLETVRKALEPAASPQHIRGAQKRILVIGEEEEMTEIEKLGDVGYDVTFVSNIQEGSDEVRRQRPDAILIDGSFVKTDNYDGFYQLNLEFALTKIPAILLVTREELPEFQEKLESFGSYCLKPIDEIDLLGQIRMALHKN